MIMKKNVFYSENLLRTIFVILKKNFQIFNSFPMPIIQYFPQLASIFNWVLNANYYAEQIKKNLEFPLVNNFLLRCLIKIKVLGK